MGQWEVQTVIGVVGSKDAYYKTWEYSQDSVTIINGT